MRPFPADVPVAHRQRRCVLAISLQMCALPSAMPHGSNKHARRCIVAAASGRGVFDGNVRVERLAQKTDAAQLSRNLLLVPRATVNVKPNLQIVADDVKCTHGAAISDLEETQLFYLQCAAHENLMQAAHVSQGILVCSGSLCTCCNAGKAVVHVTASACCPALAGRAAWTTRRRGACWCTRSAPR